MSYRAEYMWIDGQKPTAKLRSKTKIVPDGDEPPLWGFDGSSTEQAPGEASDCVLRPVLVKPDPIRGGDDVLVLCEVLTPEMEAHESNTRAACAEVAERFAAHDPWFGIEQEYTFYKDGRPHGWPIGGFPAPQGGYYCGVGADEIWGREVVEAHTEADDNASFDDETHPTPTTPAGAWSYWLRMRGHAWGGQPSAVYRVDAPLGSEAEFTSDRPVGRTDVLGLDGELHPPDDLTDDPLGAPGSGADRLLVRDGVRVRVRVRCD